MPRKKEHGNREQLLEACLAAFVRAGTLDLSLDKLAKAAKSSKRMLVHYFGSREALEEMAMSRLEERLRARFRSRSISAGNTAPFGRKNSLGTTDRAAVAWNPAADDGPDAEKLERVRPRQAIF